MRRRARPERCVPLCHTGGGRLLFAGRDLHGSGVRKLECAMLARGAVLDILPAGGMVRCCKVFSIAVLSLSIHAFRLVFRAGRRSEQDVCPTATKV